MQRGSCFAPGEIDRPRNPGENQIMRNDLAGADRCRRLSPEWIPTWRAWTGFRTFTILPRQESFASLHILTRRASEGSEALPSLARRVRMSFFGARVGCPVCAHFVHYTSRRNRVPPRRGFRVEVQ